MALKDLVTFGRKDVPARREVGNPFALFRKEFDDLFDNFFRSFDLQPFEGRTGTFSPRLDVAEDGKEIRISAELPGMDEKDIDVSLQGGMLTIRGEKKEEKEDKGKDYYRMERSYGSFSRTLSIPVEVESDKIEAHFRKGVLSITLPKTAKTAEESKKITVKIE